METSSRLYAVEMTWLSCWGGQAWELPFLLYKPVGWLKLAWKLLWWFYGCVSCPSRIPLVLSRLHLCEATLGHAPEQQFCLVTTSVNPGFQTLPCSSSSYTQPSNPRALVPLTSVPTAICSLFLPGLSLAFCSPGSAQHVSLKDALACHFLGQFSMSETTKKGKKFRSI